MSTPAVYTVDSRKTYTKVSTTLPSGRTASVELYHDFDAPFGFGGGDPAVTVNWSALGSTSIADAAAYAALLARAAEEATIIERVGE